MDQQPLLDKKQQFGHSSPTAINQNAFIQHTVQITVINAQIPFRNVNSPLTTNNEQLVCTNHHLKPMKIPINKVQLKAHTIRAITIIMILIGS